MRRHSGVCLVYSSDARCNATSDLQQRRRKIPPLFAAPRIRRDAAGAPSSPQAAALLEVVHAGLEVDLGALPLVGRRRLALEELADEEAAREAGDLAGGEDARRP